MTASTNQATEARYSVYTPDGKAWKVWDARDERFIQNPMYDFPSTDFDFRTDAARLRDELNAADTQPAPETLAEQPRTDDSDDDEPGAPSASEIARSVCEPQDKRKPQPRTRAAKPGRFNSVTRRLHNLRLIVARVNSGQYTAADYLATALGADADFTRRYSSPYGKAAKAAYIEMYGTEPEKTGLDVRGHRLVRVYAYTAAVLKAAAARYARTAALIGA